MQCQHVIAVKRGFVKWNDLLKATPTQLGLAITMEKVPLLTDYGIGIYNGGQWWELTRSERIKARQAKFQKERQDLRNNHKAVETTIKWLNANAVKIKTPNRNHTSYGYKHCAEHDIGYITNGIFIAAAIMAGFTYKIREDSPNVEFGISNRSIKEWYDRKNSTE